MTREPTLLVLLDSSESGYDDGPYAADVTFVHWSESGEETSEESTRWFTAVEEEPRHEDSFNRQFVLVGGGFARVARPDVSDVVDLESFWLSGGA